MGRIERVKIPYAPRDQFNDFHIRPQRWACIAAHRRAGKTVACVNELIKGALLCKNPDPRFGYLAPYYAQAKDVAWTYLKQYTAAIPGVSVNESELRVDLPNGGRVRLYGADNYDRMRGIYLDGVILDEYADMDPRAWPEVIRPALSDRKGWATFIGTPKGRNAFYLMMQEAHKSDDWFAAILRASETGLVEKDELDDARRMMTPEQYEQEYECSFEAALVGAYYSKEMADLAKSKRIRSVPHDPAYPVQTGWDLGLDDSTAVWFVQMVGSEIRVIDYFETNNTSLTEIVRTLKNEYPYNYGEHYFPHDVGQRELMTAKSRKESIEALGLRDIVVAPQSPVMDGINAARMLLPRCVFDEKKCEHGIEVLRQYRREWDDKLKAFRQRPLHDWASHGADAFRTLAMMLRPVMQRSNMRRRPNLGLTTTKHGT